MEVVRAADPDSEAACARRLSGGGAVVLPTDTVYGVAALASHPGTSARLLGLKGRGRDAPLAVLCSDAESALALAAGLSPDTVALAERHWPGPLTLVVTRHHELDWDLGEPADTIGLRVPDHSFVRAVARRVGPLACTSANRHGRPTPATAPAAAAELLGPVDLVVDGGQLSESASTVVDCTGAAPVVLRQGPVRIGA